MGTEDWGLGLADESIYAAIRCGTHAVYVVVW